MFFSSGIVFGQTNIFVPFPDSLKTAKLYFSPLLPPSTITAVIGLYKVGEPYDSIRPVSSGDIINEESVSRPKYVYIIRQDEAYDSGKLYLIEDTLKGKAQAKKNWLTISIDTAQEINRAQHFLKSERYEGYYSSPIQFKTISQNGKVLLVPNTKDRELVFKAYPVVISNLTNETQLLYIKSYALELTQEAKDKEGRWRPIELPFYFMCGMGFHWRALSPTEQILTSVFKYKGSYKTLLRVKLQCRDWITYSEPFTGSINYSQFDAAKVHFIDTIPYERKNSR